MNSRLALGRLNVLFLTAGLSFFFTGLARSAYAGGLGAQQSSQGERQASPAQQNQQPPPPPQDLSAPKPKKVWTNEDLLSLRSPADNYRAEKEAQQAAEAEEATRKADLRRQAKEAGLTVKLPATPEETQRLIRAKEEQIRDIRDGLDRLSHDLPDAPAEQTAKIQKQIEALTGDSQKAQLELKVLEDHLLSLAKTTSSEPPSAPATPPSPPNFE